VASPVKISIRVENGPGSPREGGEAVELEMAVDDDAVGHPSGEGVPDVPQGGRPDLAVVVLVGVRPVARVRSLGRRLRDDCAARGRCDRYPLFEAYDLAGDDRPRPTYAELARRHGLTTIDVTNELAAARREFRRFVVEALRQQCASDEEFESELRGLTG